MQSTMTEREFRERITRLTRRETTSADDAVEVAREAGLEFAPEPPELPAQIYACNGGLRPTGRPWRSLEEMSLGYAAAADRYNAYPGLRAAAERVVRQAAGWTALKELKIQLAKGPK